MTEEFIRFLIVGKSGSGKSATGNSIIGEKKFQSKASTTSTTKKCQREVARVQGHNVVVVDCPGLADTDIETDGGLERLQEEIINIFAIHPDSFDAVVITLRFDLRITEEERRVIQELDILFEEHFVKQCGIFIVTHADSYDPEENDNIPIEQSEQSHSALFTGLLEKCNGRVVYFDNKTKDQSIRHDQVKRLLDLAVEAKQNPPSVSSEIFVRARKTREDALIKAKQPVIDINTETSLWLIIQDLQSIPPDSKDVELFKKIKTRLLEQRRPLYDKNRTTHKLDNVISSFDRVEDAVTLRIAAIELKLDMTEAIEFTAEAVGQLRQLLQAYADMKFYLMTAKLPQALAPIITKLMRTLNPRYKTLRNQECCVQ